MGPAVEFDIDRVDTPPIVPREDQSPVEISPETLVGRGLEGGRRCAGGIEGVFVGEGASWHEFRAATKPEGAWAEHVGMVDVVVGGQSDGGSLGKESAPEVGLDNWGHFGLSE